VVLVLREGVHRLVTQLRDLATHDALTGALAHLVAAAKRRSDVFGRIGGEEFAVVLPDTGLAGAASFAEKLRERLGETMGDVTVSFGVTSPRTR
jgi:diguanylate cyclase (GGDEF)-like protein